MEERKKLIGNRKYKDRLFRMLIDDKKIGAEYYMNLKPGIGIDEIKR